MNSSILYKHEAEYTLFDRETVFKDLLIDKIVAQIIDTRGIDSIYEYFLQKPVNREDIEFRLSIITELDNVKVYDSMQHFLSGCKQFKLYLEYSGKLPQIRARQKWLLDAAYIYCSAVIELHHNLTAANLKSEGLLRLNDCFSEYINTRAFDELQSNTFACYKEISGVRYTIDMNLVNYVVEISKDSGGENYFDKVAEVFGKFDCSALDRQIIALPGINLGPLELMILDSLNKVYPIEFGMLDGFYKDYKEFDYKMVDRLESELQFYFSYMDYIGALKLRGFEFSYPVLDADTILEVRGGYDLSLICDDTRREDISPNDFTMSPEEGCFVITGPNQGGKTSYARMLGQIAYFISLGLPAPCSSVNAGFFEGIYTHFARDEDVNTNLGRLKEELVRIKEIFDSMPCGSMVIFNEIFNSTTPHDAYEISLKVLDKIKNKGICIFASHINELASAPGVTAIRMWMEDSCGKRLYRAVRGMAQGRTFSNHLLNKYRLNCGDIKERIV